VLLLHREEGKIMDGLSENTTSFLMAFGVGGVLGAYFSSLFEQRKQIKEEERKLKSRRYGAIIIQMLTILDPEDGLRRTKQFRPDLKTAEDFKKEIETELLNSLLFASDEVIRTMADFLRRPNYSAYIKTTVAMRKDLWGRKTTIAEKELTVLLKERSSGT
jgi:hypothetical protein